MKGKIAAGLMMITTTLAVCIHHQDQKREVNHKETSLGHQGWYKCIVMIIVPFTVVMATIFKSKQASA
jgi:hypothetical protein